MTERSSALATTMDVTTEQPKALFSVPEPDLPFAVVRNRPRYPGWTNESSQALLDCMRDGHRRLHDFFNAILRTTS